MSFGFYLDYQGPAPVVVSRAVDSSEAGKPAGTRADVDRRRCFLGQTSSRLATTTRGNGDSEQNHHCYIFTAIAIADRATTAIAIVGLSFGAAARAAFAAHSAGFHHSTSAGHSASTSCATRARRFFLAIVRAPIAIDAIAIVAFFHAAPNKAVTAARFEASIETRVDIRRIAVVTSFARLDHAIATRGARARIRARIAIVLISVVARLDARFDISIAAFRIFAALDAAIGVARIGVVAFFDSIEDKPVAARGILAVCRACIGIR